MMRSKVAIVGAGLAGSEAALQLAARGITVDLFEMRPVRPTPVHETDRCAELVCSNSLKSTKAASAAGMLKEELRALDSFLLAEAERCAVPAGGALAVDRVAFSQAITKAIEQNPRINLIRREVCDLAELEGAYSAIILATGPLTSDSLANSLQRLLPGDHLAFYDAAAPIVMADSLDYGILFRQSRYEGGNGDASGESGDYLNAPFTKEEYERFIQELLGAKRVIAHDFETRELFQACQPIEEIARKGADAPRFGPLKPVGLTDPRTGRRPWAVLQLRAENAAGSAYNLVGFQTNLTFPEQKRVFSLIPGLKDAEFARYGVMHRNTFLDAPRLLTAFLQVNPQLIGGFSTPLLVAGQLGGTEGYCEAIRSGLHCALSVAALLSGRESPRVPPETVFGSLLAYATDPATVDYQPMHVNFGILQPLDEPVRKKGERYEAYRRRGSEALANYRENLIQAGLMERS